VAGLLIMDAIISRAKRLHRKNGQPDVFTSEFEINLMTTLMPFRFIDDPIWGLWNSEHQVFALKSF
jgi:hypothetical protein